MQVETPEVGAEKPNTQRGNTTDTYDSRIADKFVVRMPSGIRQQVDEHARAVHISMNSFIVQAIKEKLDRENRQQLMLDALALAVRAQQPVSQHELEAPKALEVRHHA